MTSRARRSPRFSTKKNEAPACNPLRIFLGKSYNKATDRFRAISDREWQPRSQSSTRTPPESRISINSVQMHAFSSDHHSKSMSGPPWSGHLLRAAREVLGLSTQDLSERTRIRRGLIESIERDDFEDLPAAAYTRGLLIQIAKALALPEDEVAESYSERIKVSENVNRGSRPKRHKEKEREDP